jgi:hypothetical protein
MTLESSRNGKCCRPDWKLERTAETAMARVRARARKLALSLGAFHKSMTAVAN